MFLTSILLSSLLVRAVTQLRAAHARGETAAGLDVVKGEVGDMWALGIREAYKSKLQVPKKKKNTPTGWPPRNRGDLCCMDV